MTTPYIFVPAHAAPFEDRVAADASVRRPRQTRKRTASEAAEPDRHRHSDPTPTHLDSPDRLLQETSAFTSLTAQQHAQLQTAGLKPGEEIPSSPFPHRLPTRRGYILRDVRTELEDLQPPVAHLDVNYYAPQPFKSNEQRTTLREQHVAVLTTLLHCMLQKGDYQRAGRAWALLLRSGQLARGMSNRQGVAGMDVRTHERWGIGAELLMRRRTSATGSGLLDMSDRHLNFSDEGFELARRYYERLIVQYPTSNKRKSPHASTFYAAMFSMWIYEASERFKHGVTVMAPPMSPSSTRSGMSNDGSSLGGAAPASEGDEDSRLLHDAKAIATRMDDIVDVPPHDKNGELLYMRAMVELWIADLAEPASSRHIDAFIKAAALLMRAQQNGIDLNDQAREVVATYGVEREDDDIVEEEDTQSVEDDEKHDSQTDDDMADAYV